MLGLITFVFFSLGCSGLQFYDVDYVEESKNYPTMKWIVKSINEDMLDEDFTKKLLKLPNLDDIFIEMDPLMLSRVFRKIEDPDNFLAKLNDEAFVAVMSNLPDKTYFDIEDIIPNSILRINRLQHGVEDATQEEQECCSNYDCSYHNPYDLIHSMLPNIPVEYADCLYGIDIPTLQIIVTQSNNLPCLLAAMSTSTFEYIYTCYPIVIGYMAIMDAQTQLAIISKMPYPCDFLKSIPRQYAYTIIKSLPFYRICLEPPKMPAITQ